jgi:dolichol-phosphate mannosyltransferase
MIIPDMKPLVVIPTYNEAENLPLLIPRLFEAVPECVHVMIVDDSSPDGTAEVARELATHYPGRMMVEVRPAKAGLASAYIRAFVWGISNGYDRFIEMDADMSHDPAVLKQMLLESVTSDVVIGSRNIPGGCVIGWEPYRNFLSKVGSWYSRTVLGCPIRDLTGGYNLWTKRALRQIDLAHILSEGYFFQVEMKYRAYRKKLRIKEIPITFTDRKFGSTKMSFKIVLEGLLRVWQLRFS